MNKKEKEKPFTKRTFQKEANAIARKAAKKGSLKILAKSLERQQSREKKRASKTKKSKKDKDTDTDTDSDSGSDSDESIQILEAVPRKTEKSRLDSVAKNRSTKVTIATDTFAEKEAKMKERVAKRQKELGLKNCKKLDTAAAEEAAFLEATAEEERLELPSDDEATAAPDTSDMEMD